MGCRPDVARFLIQPQRTAGPEAAGSVRCSPRLANWPPIGPEGQVRSGQVYYPAEVQDHESHKAAWATPKVSTGLNLATLESPASGL